MAALTSNSRDLAGDRRDRVPAGRGAARRPAHLERRRSGHRAGPVRRAARSQRRRQDDPDQRRPGTAGAGWRPCDRARRPPGQARDRIGYLPQRRSFDASLRVRGRDIVRLGLDGHRWGLSLPGLGRGPAPRGGPPCRRRARAGRRLRLREPHGRPGLGRRAAAPADRPGARARPAVAHPGRAPRRSRPAQSGRGRRPDQPHLLPAAR